MNEIPPDIKRISQASPAPKPRDLPSRGNGIPGEFGRLLDAHLDAGADNAQAPQGGLPELEATYAAKRAGMSPAGSPIPDRISDTLDLLERYARNLADPSATLKQAYGLLEQAISRTKALNRDLSWEDDPKLREITAHLSTVVELEKIKMDRGDYS